MALDRARQYRDAGADALFVEAPVSEGEVERVAGAFPDVPLVYNWGEGGRTLPLPLERLRELGFRFVVFPIGAPLAATSGIRRLLDEIRVRGTPATRSASCRVSKSSLTSSGYPRSGGSSSGSSPRDECGHYPR